MNELIELKLIGITYNQIESGVYALLLEDPVTKRRLPIVIGLPEAQSIECKLQDVKTPRPLSHDVMASIIRSLNASLKRIYIHRLPTGVFAASLVLVDELGRTINVDSRSSDAIALAIRMNAPICTSAELMQKSGFDPDKAPAPKANSKFQPRTVTIKSASRPNDLSKLTKEELQTRLMEAVNEEKYELAAKIKMELEKREGLAENS